MTAPASSCLSKVPLHTLLRDGEGVERAAEGFVAAFRIGQYDKGNSHFLRLFVLVRYFTACTCGALLLWLDWRGCESGHK